MSAAETRPRLAPKARLRRDRRTGRTLLLYPERGLLLSATAARIAGLCTGERTAAEIAARLAEEHGAAPELVERDVRAFLADLAERGLLVHG